MLLICKYTISMGQEKNVAFLTVLSKVNSTTSNIFDLCILHMVQLYLLGRGFILYLWKEADVII